jgi:hypothetical protein
MLVAAKLLSQPFVAGTRRMSTAHGHKYTNRLVHEKSPYLLQHAHNPVQWYVTGVWRIVLRRVLCGSEYKCCNDRICFL